MERCWSLDEVLHDPRSVITVGTFDGVHLGHHAILRFLAEQARARNARPVVVTFDPHPRSVVHGQEVSLLTTPGERAEACAALGIQRFIVLPFDRALAALSPTEFVRDVLVARIGLQAIVVGHDHGFGRGRSGGREELASLGNEYGFEVVVLPAQTMGDRVVSSSEVRRLLREQGDVRKAADLLTRRYSLSGTVVAGARRGRLLGFPTANLVPSDHRKLVPAVGVYAVRVSIEGEPDSHAGMMNVGRRPTFEETGLHLEIHLFDFDRDLYDARLRVEFVERMRDERRFSGVDALVAQLREDEARCRSVLRDVY